MKIGITDTLSGDKFEQYVAWIRSAQDDAEIVRLSHVEENAAVAGSLDGLVLSGGGDIHPRWHNRADLLPLTNGVDERRDEFEFDVIDRALDADRPILGVCRGMQVMNVALGGSLITDLATDGYREHRGPGPSPMTHPLAIVPHTMVHALAGAAEATVNSFHHQAADALGSGLIRSAVSADGVTEAAEWAMKDSMPFLLLVQWHPERAAAEPLSQNIVKLFLREVHQQRQLRYHH
jgi:putative glutamine amidotransferase